MARLANENTEKFEVDKLIKWKENIFYYLKYVYNTREVPLIYLVRKDYTLDVADMTMEEETLHLARLNGPMFDQDLKKVRRLIKELTIGTPAEDWIK